jgi:hypothetical protein
MESDSVGSLPLWLQWITLLLAIFGALGTLLAAQTVFVSVMSRPKVAIEFGQNIVSEKQAKSLQCWVYNRPIRNRILRLLGVARTTAHVVPVYSIVEAGTNRIIGDLIPPLAQISGGAHFTISIPPSPLPLNMPLFVVEDNGREVSMMNQGERSTRLGRGMYEVEVLVVAGEHRTTAKKRLKIGESVDDCFWAK